jgi:hypothetical protein
VSIYNVDTLEPVAKAGYFCTALAVSQAKALRNVRFSAVTAAKLEFCNSLIIDRLP